MREDLEIDDIDEVDGEQQLYEHFRFEVDKGQEPLRIDKYMCEKMQHSSRNRIQKAADAGFVHVNDKPVKSNYRVRPGDVVTLMLDRPRHDTTIEAEDIPLTVVYEDADLMVVDKPAGLVVHPGVGNFHGTLVNAIAWHLKDDKGFDPNDPEVDWYTVSTRTRADCWWWQRRPRRRRDWGCSSSTRPPTAATAPWCGETSWKTRAG